MARPGAPAVITLQPRDLGDVVEVLGEAFRDYPVMRHVLGPAGDYDARLPILVTLFASGRSLRGEPMLGVRGADGRLLAAALVTPPDSVAAPEQLLDLRERTWERLGSDARQRYDAFADACGRLGIDTPHHHLNMIGVRRAHQGSGLARCLLEAVHELARNDPHSAGVSLTTEHAPNLALYQRFGYRVTGELQVAADLRTWTLFRARSAP
ncbi:MAG: GNAT family N-acetyltransferase [Xanthomonadales bacterium]|nr:GNAT family N-acetyltransferase [Xanthomonadales bacterium]